MRFIYILLFICYVSCYYDEEDEFDERKTKLVERLSYIKPVLREGYQMVTRHVGIDVYMYRSYRTVSVVFYPVINDIRDARFTFQSEELHLNNIGSCSPKDVIIQIKYGSYPALNPDGYSFPKNFVDPDMRESIYELEMISDGSNITFSITNPRAGIYYAMAYVKWEDPRTQKVEQEGLVANCQTVLYTDLQVKIDETIENIMAFGQLTIDYRTLPKLFKFRAPDGLESIELNLHIINNTIANNNSIVVKVQANSIPMDDNLILHCAFAPKSYTLQTITFLPHPLMYHYIYIDVVEGNTTYIPDCESYALRSDETQMQIVNLMRDEKDKFFSFDYGLPTVDLIDVTSLINITSNDIKLLRFEVNQFVDIGGSLAIEASLMMSLKYYMGYKREFQKGSLLAFTEDNQYFKVVVCLDIYHASVPLESGQCKYNDKIKPALFVLNSTDSDSIYDKVIIPFPDAGLYYLTFRLFCDSAVCPCRTSDNGTKYYVKTKEMEDDNSTVSSISDLIREGETECNATVVLSISSKSCVSGKCSNNGNCGYNTFSGLVMSFCSCTSGYGGWDCSDDSRIDSHAYLLLSVLLLTLSNFLFIFSVYVATIRLYFLEGVMYAFTMVFSTFYHACDAPIQIAYCIIKGNILQFGDFYCGLMSFWVTLLAMSIIGTKLRAFFQVIGAIVIALLTTWNMHSFYAFFLPVAVGVAILFISWYLDYRKNRFMRYQTSYYTRHLPLGLVLVSVGLICYAFLQTEQNYKIVHSLWHMIIALSVVFLLPDARRRNCHPFVASREQCAWPLCGSYHRSQSP